ncbi:MAG: peptidoglycan editing factor PgeF [Clostridia bacterium]|nr:peptidoglycan editing factor PgeF [Clostridia bacterium]
MPYSIRLEQNLPYLVSSLLPARHAFLTRNGGASQGIFSSLNLSAFLGDRPECVRENCRRVCSLFGLGENDAAVTCQVHGKSVRIVTEADRHECLTPVSYEADAIVTNVEKLPLLCFSADCMPLLMQDPVAGVASAVHCGWRSSVSDIIGATVEAMVSLGAEPERICAATGPSIGFCCFECGEEVPSGVSAYLSGETDGLFRPAEEGKTYVDLAEANRRRLIQLGILPEKIDVCRECTFCHPESYWSHRYTRGKRGVQGAAICL